MRAEQQAEQQIQKAYQAILDSDFEQAIEWFERAIDLDPDNAVYHFKLSITYMRSNKLEQALTHAEKALQLDDGNEQYMQHIHNIRARQQTAAVQKMLAGRPDQTEMAINGLKQAVEMDPLYADAYILLAALYDEISHESEAIHVLNEGLKLDPQHEDALQLKKKLLQKIKQR